MEKTTLKSLSKRVKRALNSSTRYVGESHNPVVSVMVVAGVGLSYPELVDYCASGGIDALISGGVGKKVARRALRQGVCLIDAGAAATEGPGMQELVKELWSHDLKVEYYETKELFSYV